VTGALHLKRCASCGSSGGRPLGSVRTRALLRKLPGWTLGPRGRSIRIEYWMKDFASAIDLVRRVAALAEREDHHPDILLTGYRRLRFVLSTHSLGGLSENDFILAAKIARLPKRLKAAGFKL